MHIPIFQDGTIHEKDDLWAVITRYTFTREEQLVADLRGGAL